MCTVTTTTTKKNPLRHRQRQSSDRQVPFIIHEPHFTLCLVSPSISSFSLPLSLLAFLHSFDEVAYFKSLGTSTTLLPWQRCCITYFVPWTMDMWWEFFSKISQIIWADSNNQQLFLQKTKIVRHFKRNLCLGLGYEFGLHRIRNSAIMRP